MTTTGAEAALERFRPEDADELVAMWRASFENGVGIVDPHPIAMQREYLMTKVVPESEVRVARRESRIVGFVAATRASVVQLYVHVDFQDRGIGKRMLDWAKLHSGGTLGLFTFARNHRACAFYERNGFCAVARGFEPNWRLDDVRYEWSRAEPPPS